MKTSLLKRKTPLMGYSTLKRSPFRTGDKEGKTFSTLKSKGLKRKQGDSLQAILDRIFSEYIRLLYADAEGNVQCVTCLVVRYWDDQMDAGHFIPRANMATRYDEGNVFVQCTDCNRFKGGNLEKFKQFLVKRFGENHLLHLQELGRTIQHNFPYKEKIAHYLFKLTALKARDISY